MHGLKTRRDQAVAYAKFEVPIHNFSRSSDPKDDPKLKWG